MDAYPHPRRFAGSGDAPPPPPPQQQQQPPPPSHTNHHWYPGPAPPPYPPHANHPFPPQHHQWGPPHPPPPQHQPPPPYGYHPSLPSMPMQPPPPAAGNPWPPHHAAAQPQPPSYPPPPPGQGWANLSWAQSHGYTGHGNEEDWATKAKAWAAAKSVTENHHTQQHAISTNRPDNHNYGYQDQYQQPAGLPAEPLRPPIPQSSNGQLPFQITGQHRETNYLPDGGPLAPPAKNFGSFPSAYEQEVSYNYPSTRGVGNAMIRYPSSQTQPPPTASAMQDGFPQAPSSMHIAPSLEQPHFGHDGQSSKIIVDPSNQPLEFNSRKAPDMSVHRTTNFSSIIPATPIAASDHDAHSAPAQSWVPSTTVLFPQASVPPQAAQMDPSVHAAPLFGAVSGSSYIPPAAFGVVNVTEAFPVDANTPFNVAERSKKPPVPNWLREELLKKKSTSVSASVQHSTEFHSMGSEDAEKTLKSSDQADSRSVDSAKSTDDDEEDEDEIEAARMAAINQEIKRVLTEVLLKVTDDLFDEIATKVLNEDDSSAESNEPTRVSSVKGPGLGESKPKVPAKVAVPAKPTNVRSAEHSDGTGLSSPKGALLGLASYDSDDEDDEGDDEDKVPVSNLLSETKAGAAHPEAGEKASDGEHHGNHNERNSVVQNASSGEDRKFKDEMTHRNSSTELKQELCVHETPIREFPSYVKVSSQPKDVVPTLDEKAHGYSRNGKVPPSGNNVENYSKMESGHRHLGKNSNEEDFVKEPKAVRRKELESSSKRYNDDDKSSMYGNTDKKGSLKEEKGSDRSAKHGADTREPRSRGNSKQDDTKGDRKDYQKDVRERSRDSADRREKGKHEKEDRSRQFTKGSSSHSSRRSRSPSARSRTKESSSHRESVSSDEPSDNAKRRKLHSRKSSMSPSPPKSRNRRVSRSPHSKHSHRRHSPYSSAERKKRSRSRTPVKRR